MIKTNTNTFCWLSVEDETRGEPHETVDFAEILRAVSLVSHDTEEPGRTESTDRSTNLPDVVSASDLDARDVMLAQERLQDAEWVDWADVRRELQRSS